MKKVFFILLFFFVGALTGHAQVVEVIKRPSGIVSTKTIRGKRIETELQYIYVNGEIAYCVEPGVALGSSYIQSEDFLSVGIGESLKKELELITYYGYEYDGHASPYYYAATQAYIWEKMGATDITFTQNGQVLDIQPYKIEILRLFLQHDTLPSFAFQKYEMNVGETLKLKDGNGVLEHFTTSNGDVKINQNTLLISSKKEGINKISFIQKKKQGKSLVYFSSSNQNIATFTLDDVYSKKFDITITSKIKKGTLKIQKLDQDNNKPLEGAEFYLYHENEIVGKGKTGKDGYVIFENLIYGKYKIKEEIAPKGYIKNEKQEEVVLDSSEKIVPFVNEKHHMPVTSNIDKKYFFFVF